MPSTLNLRLQASTPSNHLCSTFLSWAPPHFLNQAPPGAQQLTLPDFANVPHLGHVIVLAIVEVIAGVPIEVVISACFISSRLGIGRRDTDGRVACIHTVRDIEPDDRSNIPTLLALELTQADPQSCCLNDVAFANM